MELRLRGISGACCIRSYDVPTAVTLAASSPLPVFSDPPLILPEATVALSHPRFAIEAGVGEAGCLEQLWPRWDGQHQVAGESLMASEGMACRMSSRKNLMTAGKVLHLQ